MTIKKLESAGDSEHMLRIAENVHKKNHKKAHIWYSEQAFAFTIVKYFAPIGKINK
jgi:hypothetical protein